MMSPVKINSETLKNWQEANAVCLIDVREPVEHQSVRIPGARLVPLGQIDLETLDLKPGQKLVLHCGSGNRSRQACEKLLKQNPNLEVCNLEGGIKAWMQSGFAVENSTRKILPLDRQVQLTIGLGVLTFSLLGYFVNPLFFIGSAFFGAGLTFAGLSGTCGLALLMAKMPWNRLQTVPKSFCGLPPR